MDTQSLWNDIVKKNESFETLQEDIEVDVAVIGGGITGITAALELMNAGKKVALIEAHDIGGYTTGYSTGNLYVPVQPYYQHISEKFNDDIAAKVADSRNFAINYIEKNVIEKKIDCQFARRPWFAYTNDDSKIKFFNDEFETFKRIHLNPKLQADLPLPFKFKKAMILENQARLNPLQYTVSLAEYLKQNKCLIYTNTRITEIDEEGYCKLETSTGKKIIAEDVIIATHTPFGVHPIHFFTAPYRSYVVSAKLKNNEYPEGHFWDLDSPHHATCTHPIKSNNPEILMVAGSHHKVGQNGEQKHFAELESFLKNHFDISEIAYQWSAQHYKTGDYIPYIGLGSGFKHTYLATGYFADGLVYGTLAGLILCDTILNNENHWAETYQSKRSKLLSTSPFIFKENLNTLLQYGKDLPFLRDKLDDIKEGTGKVVEIDREKCAVYRDENNHLHMVSAVCTHMKCIVNWNGAEKTWDCPCHGSRFTVEGKVIEGPAKFDLSKKGI